MNIPTALVMQQVRSIPLIGPKLADSLKPTDLGAAVTVALGVMNETAAVPHLPEQRLPWLARGAVVVQILGCALDTPITLDRTEKLIEGAIDTFLAGLIATPAEVLAPGYEKLLPKLREKLPEYQAIFPSTEEAKQLYHKVQAVAVDAAARIKEIVNTLFKAAAPAPAQAAASSSSAAAPVELPLVLRFLRDGIAHVRELQALPAGDSVADLAAIEKVKDVTEITFKDIDLTFKQLEAMGHACKNLKKLQLGEGVTLAGSKHFDTAAVEFFFDGVEVTGAPCVKMAGNMHELMMYDAALNISKEQLWKHALSLHNAAHTAHADLHEETHQTWVEGQTAALVASAKEEAAKLASAPKSNE